MPHNEALRHGATHGGSGDAAGVVSAARRPTTPYRHPFGPHQASIPSNQRGVQFDVLTDLVRARRPHFIWHLNKACSRVATHILAEQTPGFMQSACHDALALAAARKTRVAPFKRASANLDTEGRLLIMVKNTMLQPTFIRDSNNSFQRRDSGTAKPQARVSDCALWGITN
jgi:hypothetical protein